MLKAVFGGHRPRVQKMIPGGTNQFQQQSDTRRVLPKSLKHLSGTKMGLHIKKTDHGPTKKRD